MNDQHKHKEPAQFSDHGLRIVPEANNTERPRRGVVLALDQHFKKYFPDILDDFNYPEDDFHPDIKDIQG